MQPRLDGRAWLGTARAYDNTFVVELFESKRHPGHYHYVTACAADGCCYETKDDKPVRATEEGRWSFWRRFRRSLSRRHGLVLADFEWVEVPADQLPVSGERVRAGV